MNGSMTEISKNREAGFTYLSLLFSIVVIGIALGAAGQVWSTAAKREKEAELIFRGNAISKAIGLYYEAGTVRTYPRELEDLLKDPRQLTVKRYLRKIYEDPMTRTIDWDLIKTPDGGVMGIKSRSGDEVIKKDNFPAGLELLKSKQRYYEWEFVFSPAIAPVNGPVSDRSAG